MVGVARGDDHRVDIRPGDHILAGRICLDAVFFRNRFAEVLIDVRTRDDLRAGQLVVDAFDVGTADRTGTHQTDFQFLHNFSLHCIFRFLVKTPNDILIFDYEHVLVMLQKIFAVSCKYFDG